MILIGENIHAISKEVSEAIRERRAEPLKTLAIRQKEAGVDYIDLNVGPLKKDPEALAWLVQEIQQVVDLPLSLDTMNPEAMDLALAVCKNKALINSASGKTESKEKMLPLAVKYQADVIISTLTDNGIPPDATSRAEAIMETVAYANEMGIPNEKIWIDPILFPICVDQPQVKEAFEFIKMIEDICPGCKSTIGGSNLSQGGVPLHLRGILNRTCLVIMERYGLYSAIVDSFDEELMKLGRGQLPELRELIYKAMDGEVDRERLSPKEMEYVKTVDVLMGRTLYSHTWLEA